VGGEIDQELDFDGLPTRLVNSKDIEAFGFGWMMRDSDLYTLDVNEPVIFNLDVWGNPGTHWITVMRGPSNVYVYDPLSTDVNKVPTEIRDFAARNRLGIVSNPHQHQFIKSNFCGYFALMMADLMKRNLPMTPAKYKALLVDTHGTSPDVGDVKRLMDYVECQFVKNKNVRQY
jgi:hypothetical protein